MVPKGRNEMRPPEVWSQELENHQEQACCLHDSVPPVSGRLSSNSFSLCPHASLPFLSPGGCSLPLRAHSQNSLSSSVAWCLCVPIWIFGIENVVGRAWLSRHQEPITEEQGICHHIMCRDFGNPTLTEGGVVGWAAPSNVERHWGWWGLAEIRGLKDLVQDLAWKDTFPPGGIGRFQGNQGWEWWDFDILSGGAS